MKKKLLVVGMASVCLLVMGIAKRALPGESPELIEAPPHDMHFRYYLQIRPALQAADRTGSALCGGEQAGR